MWESTSRWSPWRHLREHYPDIRVHETELPDGLLGCLDHEQRLIWLDSRLFVREQRSTLAHELGHLALDALWAGGWMPAPEHVVDRWAARRLLGIDSLLHAMGWTSNLDEMAEELWVDPHTLRTRLRYLTDDEQDAVMHVMGRRWVAA